MSKYIAILTGVIIAASAPAFAGETIIVPFTQYDASTVGLYDGVVDVTVSGVGQAYGSSYSDAFYQYTGVSTPETPWAGSWVMSFGLTTLGSFGNGGIPISTAIVGGIPAYSPSHVYNFAIDTGVSTPTLLHFGISDDYLTDNSGAYTVTLGAVDSGAFTVTAPEPSTWAMMLLGFGGLGFAGYRSSRKSPVALV